MIMSMLNGADKEAHHHRADYPEADNNKYYGQGFDEKHTGYGDHNPHGAYGMKLYPPGHAFFILEIENILPQVPVGNEFLV